MQTWSDDNIIAKLCQDFSSLSTMNRAREELKSLYQEQGEPITMVYLQIQSNVFSLHRYQIREGGLTHSLLLDSFQHWSLNSNRIAAKRYTEARNKPCTLEDVFQLAEQCSRKMQEASSLIVVPP